MDYSPGNLPGEESQMGTYHSRGLHRTGVALSVACLVGGLVLVLLAEGGLAAFGAVLLALGALGTVLGVAGLVLARRRPAPPTAGDAYTGPREAGW